jgi:hypothetical protein
MLYVSLILTALYLLVTNVAAWKGKTLGTACALAWGGLVLGTCIASRAFLLEAVLTGVAGLVCLWARAGGRSFLVCSLGGAVLAYGVFGGLAAWEIRGLVRRYPMESLDQRLAYERRGAGRGLPAGGEASGTEARLVRIEEELDFSRQNAGHHYRNYALEMLHEDRVQRFVNSPGFGVFRGTYVTSRAVLELPEVPPLPQPEDEFDYPVTQQGPAGADGKDVPAEKLATLHEQGLLDFAGPLGFGYARDRRHVAGFQAHQFREVPSVPKERWRLRRLELVSLLKFPAPAVYLSENLPRMDELREAPTRPLDPFERGALLALRRGEDLVVRQDGERLRVLGSIRAAKQCLDCHEVERGTLLGAFSYKLRRAP